MRSVLEVIAIILCIGTENIFISPRLFFQDGRVPRRIFCEERIAIAFVIPGNLYLRKKYNINMNIMNIILEAVNIPKYFPLRFLFSFAIYLKLIRLAMDAIRVPRPPILVPTIKAR